MLPYDKKEMALITTHKHCVCTENDKLRLRSAGSGVKRKLQNILW